MSLERRVAKLTSILQVATAMTVERDLDRLLMLIASEAKQVVEADRCTIFVRDRDTGELWSRVGHGLELREIRLPAGHGIAGHVARHDTVLNIADPYADPRFNKSVDATTGYRTRAILAVPMRGPRGEVVGVLQALNPLRSDAPFDAEDEELLLALGGQAAAAIQNAFLYDAIEELFEGLVRASIVAIESRDPATSGHSERVAALTVALAEAVDRVTTGPYAQVRFSAAELRELRYACLLHDMGKVGVREHVLVKPNKLLPEHEARIAARIEVARACAERDHALRLLDPARTDTTEEDSARELDRCLAELDAIEALVARTNRPVPLSAEDRTALDALAQHPGFACRSHARERVVSDEELELLRIPRGSLSHAERLEIEGHVSHSYRFLVQIPWTEDLARVPELAWGHHEKLDGRGYPRGLTADDIPLGTRMMTIADIYDALTAADRPYKRAMSHERALAILEEEARSGGVDPALLAIFIAERVAERVLGDTR